MYILQAGQQEIARWAFSIDLPFKERYTNIMKIKSDFINAYMRTRLETADRDCFALVLYDVCIPKVAGAPALYQGSIRTTSIVFTCMSPLIPNVFTQQMISLM